MKVPNSISDADWKKLQKRAEKVASPMFSKKTIDQRKANSERLKKFEQN